MTYSIIIFLSCSGYICYGYLLLKWVNDGLMALFFFLLGLEMKYQIIEGEFNEKKRLLILALAAIGPFIVPASLY